MTDPTTLLLLRVVHILGGVFWVGSAVMIAWFLRPSQRALGPEGGRFMQHLFGPGRLPLFLGVSLAATVLTGLALYGRWVRAGGTSWIESGRGTALGIGGAMAILAAAVGFGNGITNGVRLGRVRERVEASSHPPDDRLVEEMERLDRRMSTANHVIAILLIGSVVAMAGAGHF